MEPPGKGGHEKHGDMKVFQVDGAFKNQLKGVYAVYFDIQKALAVDDFSAAKKAAKDMDSALEKVDMKLVKGDAHLAWMSQLEEIRKTAQGITKTDKISSARNAFLTLSKTLIHVADNFKPGFDQPVVHVHCSMAFDGKGGHWLQEGKEVENPYYGKAMSKCGDVMDEK